MTRRRVLHGVAVAYGVLVLIGIGFATLSPVPMDALMRPLIVAILNTTQRIWPLGLWNYTWLESITNAYLFVPLGVLLALALGRHRWWLMVSVALALPLAIEFVQGEFLPRRTASPEDVLLNAFGVALGFWACILIELGVPRQDSVTPGTPDPPA